MIRPFLIFSAALLAASAAQETHELEIKAVPGLRYDPLRLQVPPGVPIKLTVANADQMMHNLVIAKPGSQLTLVQEALALADKGPEMQFVPKSADVLWHTKVLAPGESQVLEFQSPAETGVYPYVCTYPGHGFIMYGALYVGDQELPPLKEDRHVPRLQPQLAGGSPFLSPLNGTRVVREFMPDSGPAAIAIGMPNGVSACWDAGICQLRYAWAGGFIEIPFHKNDRTKLLGEVFHRQNLGEGLAIGDSAAREAEFLGYRLLESYPQFRYRLNGVEVRELIHLSAEGELARTFEIAETSKVIRFSGEAKPRTFTVVIPRK